MEIEGSFYVFSSFSLSLFFRLGLLAAIPLVLTICLDYWIIRELSPGLIPLLALLL